MVAGAIELNVASPHYTELHSLYEKFESQHSMQWHETLDIQYEPRDLEQCRILTLWIIGSAGPGDNEYGRVYSSASKCLRCGVEQFRNQVAPLMLDPARVEDSDFSLTDHHEIICSERARNTLVSLALSGLRFGLLAWTSGRNPNAQVMYQLHVDTKLGPLSGSVPLKREHRCEVCGEYRNIGIAAPGHSGERELRFPASSYHGESLARTAECFGDRRKFPLLIVSQSLFNMFRKLEFTGWRAEPAHIESP